MDPFAGLSGHAQKNDRIAELERENERLRKSQPLLGSSAELGALREEVERLRELQDMLRRLLAERTEEVARLRAELKRRATASAERTQMDGAEIERLRAENDLARRMGARDFARRLKQWRDDEVERLRKLVDEAEYALRYAGTMRREKVAAKLRAALTQEEK